jgi:outer membrane protein assembly factor BamA
MPISEPAVGYGLAGGFAFIGRPQAGRRPNITFLGGAGTENGTWAGMAADSRTWDGGRLQTLVAVLYASVNLDWYGLSEAGTPAEQPVHYNLEPKGGGAQARYRIGGSQFWAGLGYGFLSTTVTFDASANTPSPPDSGGESKVGGVGLSFLFDSRNNIFTTTEGTFVEAIGGVAGPALGGDTEFQRLSVIVMQYAALPGGLFLGLRGQATAAFGDTPFYLEPFVVMRGVPAMRYHGEQTAQVEAELRWQFWKRLSLVGFFGGGGVWNEVGRFNTTQWVTAGGTGLRYELARRYGIHVGADAAFGPDGISTIYIIAGSAWSRP